RKAFLQGFSAQARWKDGLFVPTQITYLESGSFEKSFSKVKTWENLFHLFFRQGQAFYGWSLKRFSKPNPHSRFQTWPFFVAGIFSFINAILQDWAAAAEKKVKRLLTRSKESKLQFHLPLERFFLASAAGLI